MGLYSVGRSGPCTSCPVGRWGASAGATSSFCTGTCPTHKTTLAAGQTCVNVTVVCLITDVCRSSSVCKCQGGYTGPDGLTNCTACGLGKSKQNTGPGPC